MIRLDVVEGGHPPTLQQRGTEMRRALEVARYDSVPDGCAELRSLAWQAARVADVPVAGINLMKASTQRTVVSVGADVTVLDRRDSLCGAAIDSAHWTHVRDASHDERWWRNPFVDGRWARVRFYGAHPLRS